jgi:DNA-binding MarR family transcriptional regulator
MNQIVSRVHAESTEEFRRMGFNLQGARVLIVLLQNPGCYIGQLSEITTIDDSTLSHMLSRLSRRGLLERRRDTGDTRFVSVHLTAEGKRIARGCKTSSDRRERKMLSALSAAEVATLRGLLSQVFNTVRSPSWHASLRTMGASDRTKV